MTPSPYTEDSLVQQTIADYLELQLGWESVYAHNREDFGQGSLLGRKDDREVVLKRTLNGKLTELNPGLLDTAYDDGLRQIVTTTATQTLFADSEVQYGIDDINVSEWLEHALRRDYHIITAEKRLNQIARDFV